MTRGAPRSRPAPRGNAGLLCALLLALSACAPDRWFDVDWDRAVKPARPVVVPEAYDPKTPPAQPPPDDGPLVLSIEQATLLAIERNRDLRVQRLEPVIAGAFELIERGAFDPTLFGSLAYEEDETSQTTDVTGEQFGVQSDSDAAEVGLRQPLPTGTDVELSATTERSASSRRPEQFQSRLGLDVTQALLRGFGPAVNLVRVRQAELDTLASAYELRGFTESLLAQTEVTYWRLALAQQRIAIFENSLELARRQLDEVEQSIDVGTMARTEAAVARAEAALREQALIDARSDLEAQRLQLLRLVNPSADNSLDRPVQISSDPRIEPVPLDDVADRLLLAEQLRADLNEARLRLRQDRLETIVTRNGLLPRLDLFITLGKTGYSDSYRNAWREIDGDTYDFAAGISFEHALGNRAAEGRDLAARAARQQSAAAVANLRQLVRLDVRLAAVEVERARQQIGATAATRALQEETLRAEQERLRVGSSTSLLVAQAQRDLLASQIAQVEAVVDYRVALVNLYLAEGSLLERRGVTLAAAEPAEE